VKGVDGASKSRSDTCVLAAKEEPSRFEFLVVHFFVLNHHVGDFCSSHLHDRFSDMITDHAGLREHTPPVTHLAWPHGLADQANRARCANTAFVVRWKVGPRSFSG
jgi:hypothetical protein